MTRHVPLSSYREEREHSVLESARQKDEPELK